MVALVTGASGFLGSAVVRRLLARGEAVRVLVRPTSPRTNIADLDVEIAEGDLTDPASLDRALAGIDVAYHVAADYRLWVPDPDQIFAANVGGTANLIEAATRAKVDRIVYTSSVATLGLTGTEAPADETTPVSYENMIGAYKQSKFRAEEVAQAAAAAGAPVVIVNPSTPIGPRDVKPTPTGRMVREAALGRMPAFVDTGLNVAHVDDVAEGHLLAAEKGRIGERYILGGENMSLQEIFTAIAAITGRRPPRVKLPRRAIYPIAYGAEAVARLTGGPEPMVTVDGLKMARKKMFFSSDKARAALGYASRPAVEALRDAIVDFGAPVATHPDAESA